MALKLEEAATKGVQQKRRFQKSLKIGKKTPVTESF